MEWYLILLAVFFTLLFVMFLGLPIAFSFILVSAGAMYILAGQFGLQQFVLGMYDAICKFSLTPIPFFMIMGEVFYQSGLVTQTLDTLSKFVKKIPGRLSIITLLGGGTFAALSGSVVANTAMFGALMLPEMLRRGYSKELTTGSIMASGALAMVIPPSALAVILGSIANVSVGKILIGAILPGILLILLYGAYIIISCIIKPSLAPAYEVEETSVQDKLISVLRDILPLFFIFFLVMGLIFTGVATPTEAAALGALGSYILAAAYRKFSLKLLYNTLLSSLKVTAMILMIIAGSGGFSQILALSGASREAVQAVLAMSSSPGVLVGLMLGIAILLGFFMEQTAIMMITMPLFMPVLIALGMDQVWFCVLILICLQIGQLTPPVGLALFTMKGVSPPEVTMKHIWAGAIPYVLIDVLALIIMMAAPAIITFLPNL
jgi:tripartite ATP-independent transporter DctM subunit